MRKKKSRQVKEKKNRIIVGNGVKNGASARTFLQGGGGGGAQKGGEKWGEKRNSSPGDRKYRIQFCAEKEYRWLKKRRGKGRPLSGYFD